MTGPDERPVEQSQVTGAPLVEFGDVMRRLRAECAWKRGQSHRSLARFLLEETHETLEAIETGDAEHLREELGDLLLQVYFHAVIAEENGDFTLDDVAAGIIEKMRRRNPHVFAPETLASTPTDPEAINDVWQQIKATEKQRAPGHPVTEGIPPTLPALLYADKVLDRLSRQDPSRERLPEADAGSDTGNETGLGDRLLGLVAEARRTGEDPEQALREACRRLLASG